MTPSQDSLTIWWRNRTTGERSRLSLSRRGTLFAGGLCLAAFAAAWVLGAVSLRLHQENALLHARLGAVEELARGLRDAEMEIAAARDGLEQVRAEEARIRKWLGLDGEGGAGRRTADGAEAEGGQGSLGDVDLAVVAPEELATVAVEEGLPGEGLGYAAWALASDLADLASRLHERKRQWDALPSLTPVDGEHWVSSAFGWRRSPFTGEREFHSGVDFAGARGTPIVAAGDGTVVRTVNDARLGKAVTIDHGNGMETVYGHLDRILVRRDDTVSRGQVIGKLGSTGLRSTGPHLHYSVRVGGKYVNPRNYLFDAGLFPYPVAGR
ncbi:MAG: M23 family metallopeptidase [Deferrisomatales bacterium]|nr:M23 family metallopeptidase [Deferrisomatales bacterium]